MKLSEITVDDGLDIISDIIAPIMNIASDKDALDLFIKKKPKDGESTISATLRRLKNGLPVLLKTHKEDLIEILAALDRKPVEVYRKKTSFIKMVKDLNSLLNDPELDELFTSAKTEKEQESSGLVLVSTEDEV